MRTNGVSDEGPLTVVVSRRAKAGRARELEGWLDGICEVAAGFRGYLGADVLRPADPTREDYVLIFRFARLENLREWERSAARDEWLERAEALTEGAPNLRVTTGFEHWFGQPNARTAPPRHKMALVTAAAIYALINLITVTLGPFLVDLPLLVRSLVTTTLMVGLMTYVVMPRLTLFLRGWLYSST